MTATRKSSELHERGVDNRHTGQVVIYLNGCDNLLEAGSHGVDREKTLTWQSPRL